MRDKKEKEKEIFKNDIRSLDELRTKRKSIQKLEQS